MIDYPSIFCTIVYPICLTLSYFVGTGGDELRVWLTAYSLFLLCGKLFSNWLFKKPNEFDSDWFQKRRG